MNLHIQNFMKRAIPGLMLGVGLFAASDAEAVPARVRPWAHTQPDGSTLIITKYGDERGHFNVDQNGNLVAGDEKNGFFLASVDANGAIVKTAIRPSVADARYSAADLIPLALNRRNSKMRTAPANRRNASSKWNNTDCKNPNFRMLFTDFPVTGKNKALVILVQFKDKKFTTSNPKEFFNNLLNEPGFKENGCIGSAADFFKKSSCNQFEPEFDVFGPVTVSQNMAYYGQNDSYYNQDLRPEKMVQEACTLLDNEIDYSQYDLDGDGKVDNVYIFYAGFGEADNPETSTYTNTIWPHAWELYTSGKITCKLDGKLIDHYACSNEIRGMYSEYPQLPVGIGTFVHEFSHVMGLPDLYDVYYATDNRDNYLYYTPGSWTTLDSGPYNSDGCVPPEYGAFERFSLGWIKPTPFGKSGEYTLNPITQENNAYIIYTDKPAEFFLLENRQNEGFDQPLSGHGMLVWHIDFVQSVWDTNTVNAQTHQYVDLLEANGISKYPSNSYTLETQRQGDPFPGTTQNTALSFSTIPSLKSWSNKETDIKISGISESNKVIKMQVENANQNAGVEIIGSDSVQGNIWVDAGAIYAEGIDAQVFDMMGRSMGQIHAGSSMTVAPGIYIVATGKQSRKIVVK